MTLQHTRVFGGLAALATLGVEAWLWRTAMTEGTYYVKLTILAPSLFMLFLSLVFWPISREDNLARFGQPQMPLREYPLGTKIFSGVGLLAGIAQWSYFSGLWGA